MNERMTGYGGVDHIVKDALYERYFDTIGGQQVYKLGENNPIVSDLMSQFADAFSNPDSETYLPGMVEGCNVMSVLAYPQMLAGEAYDAEDFAEIWNKAENTWWLKEYGNVEDRGLYTIISEDGTVNNPDLLAHLAFKDLGLATGAYNNNPWLNSSPGDRTGIRLSFGYNSPGMELIGNRLWMEPVGGGSHYLPGGLNGRPFSNSGYSFLPSWEDYFLTEVWAKNLN